MLSASNRERITYSRTRSPAEKSLFFVKNRVREISSSGDTSMVHVECCAPGCVLCALGGPRKSKCVTIRSSCVRLSQTFPTSLHVVQPLFDSKMDPYFQKKDWKKDQVDWVVCVSERSRRRSFAVYFSP